MQWKRECKMKTNHEHGWVAQVILANTQTTTQQLLPVFFSSNNFHFIFTLPQLKICLQFGNSSRKRWMKSLVLCVVRLGKHSPIQPICGSIWREITKQSMEFFKIQKVSFLDYCCWLLSTLHSFVKKNLSSEEVNKINFLLQKHIVASMFPLSYVEEESFVQFCKALNPAYKPLCVETMCSALIQQGAKLEEKVKVNFSIQQTNILQLQQKVQNEAISTAATLNTWTFKAKHRYMSVTGHYLTEDFEKKN